MQLIRILALVTVTLLAGCSTIPLGSIAPLSRIDIRTTDLAMLHVALRMPDALRPQPDGVKLDVLAKLEGEPDRTASFLLVETAEVDDLAELANDIRGGFSIHVYRLDPADFADFEALRQVVADKLRQGKRASLGFGVATKEFCHLGPLSDGPLLTTTYIWTSETRHYVVASANLDLRAQSDIAAQLSQLPPC
jgi:hypothetical protein